jgi:hypothetical protein
MNLTDDPTSAAYTDPDASLHDRRDTLGFRILEGR